ncbi:MAG: SUF system NifU family Fe-S cluster assembly protein [Thermoplasmatales archaeon B_DKE]|nr:MAG: SUF system NifU family Fe-S cluster assembly protein [Thermoplasmatales archaeon B_DKE]
MTDSEMQIQVILDHYKDPRNYGEIKNETVSITEANPVCGDTLHFSLLIEGGILADIKFMGQGCSISQASASMLTESVKGKQVSWIKKLKPEFVLEMIGIELGPAREKCALLSYNTLMKALKPYE